jgi:hypothetical protein
MVKPTAVDIRAYNVGFGDCFLLTFTYGKKVKRSVLIDFGSTGKAKGTPQALMENIAEDIHQFVTAECGGVLHGVVATHRHKDHISGFQGRAGEIIETLKPKVVVQPWTEDPSAKRNAKSSTRGKPGTSGEPRSLSAMEAQYLQSFDNMRAFSTLALAAASPRLRKVNSGKIRFLADDNLANPEAVERLARLGQNGKPEYVRAGDKTALEKKLPGVKIHILGPPDLTQTETILKQRSSDKKEFWQFMQFWAMLASTSESAQAAGRELLFPEAKVVNQPPINTRWFINKADRQLGNQLLGLVRILDKAMNNTSVNLLFEVGGKKLLFPGDAQIENWAYALSEPKDLPHVKQLLADVDLYKVGHHGSRNATPRTLWEGFRHRSTEAGMPDRLKSVVSTMKGKHGDSRKRTEVPRKSLVAALEGESEFCTTEGIPAKELFKTIHIPL